MTSDGAIAADDAARWADVIDPAKRQARRDAIVRGSSGDAFLDPIRATKARADDGTTLTGRGIRDPKSRLQAIVVDFNRNGADLISATKSHALVDVARDGTAAEIGWVKPSDGILAYDRNGDGLVDPSSEISFVDDLPNARTALQGLRGFDSNGDGALTSADTGFARFLLWRDANGNGVSDPGELQSLGQAGVATIDLGASKLHPDRAGGGANEVLGVSQIGFKDGSSRAVYDVALGFADSKDPSALASATPNATSLLASVDRAPPTNAASESGNRSSSASPASPSGASGISQSRGSLDGPAGVVVEANASGTGEDAQWWRDPSVVGRSLAALAMPLAGDDTSLGSNRTSPVGVGQTDAATLQRLMLLRQNIAALQRQGGGSAAIWARGAANDLLPTLAANAQQAATAGVLRAGLGG